MKGLILASGMGCRISEYFPDTPKCLLPLSDNETLLDRQLQSMQQQNITDIIISTGYMEKKIHQFIAKRHNSLNIRYVFNEKYATTNYIYSLYLCGEYIDDDLLLMHADMVFDFKLLGELIRCNKSCVLVRNEKPTKADEKDFKGNVIDARVTEISIALHGDTAFPLAPVYKLNKKDAEYWLSEIGSFVADNNVSCYAENALNNIMDKVHLKAILYKNMLCGEVDTYEDLIRLQEELKLEKI